jgi:hypothetical protein
MTIQTVQQWLASMPATKFDQPGRGSPGAFDINRRGHDQVPDIPRVERAGTMPRTTTPAHVTPVASGLDDLPETIENLLRLCAERGISPSAVTLEEAAEELLAHARGGDAGPSFRRGAEDDDEPSLDPEVIEKVLDHLRGRMGENELRGLEDYLRSKPGNLDQAPPWLKGREAELERIAEPLDRHSASDMHELNNAMDQMEEEARARMRQLGKFDAPVGPRMAEKRGTEAWHPSVAGSPRAAGELHPPGSLIPHTSRAKPFTASDKRMAGDAALKSFAKLCGVKKKHLPRSI